MIPPESRSAAAVPARTWDPRFYWLSTGLLCLIFTGSAVWSILDPAGTRIQTEDLGFPGYTVYPLAVAKLLGVAVVLWGRSRTLTGFAFAGFLYDLVLALSGHIAQREAYGLVALLTLGVWTAAYLADRQRYGRPSMLGGSSVRSLRAVPRRADAPRVPAR